jgi:hypothetical protein
MEICSNVSEAVSSSIIGYHSLLIKAGRVSEKLEHSSILTLLVAREDFIAFSSRESFKS